MAMYLSISNMLRRNYSKSKQEWKVWVKYLIFSHRETGSGHLCIRSTVEDSTTSVQCHTQSLLTPGRMQGKPQGKSSRMDR